RHAQVRGGAVAPHPGEVAGHQRDELPELPWACPPGPRGPHSGFVRLRSLHKARTMRQLHWEDLAAIIAFVITPVYFWVPGPYPMGDFTFIAQPLFLLALLSYAIKVLRELRKQDVV